MLHDWRVILAIVLVAAAVATLRLAERQREIRDQVARMEELAARQQERADRRAERERRESATGLHDWLEQSGLSDRLTVGSDGQLHAIRGGEWW